MNPFPSEAQLDWLRGDRLDLVGTAEFMIYFSFDSGGVIQTTEPLTLLSADSEPMTYDPQTRSGDWGFHKILGASVSELRLVDEMTLQLSFAPAQLLIRSTAGPYEAGRIGFPDGAETVY